MSKVCAQPKHEEGPYNRKLMRNVLYTQTLVAQLMNNLGRDNMLLPNTMNYGNELDDDPAVARPSHMLHTLYTRGRRNNST